MYRYIKKNNKIAYNINLQPTYIKASPSSICTRACIQYMLHCTNLAIFKFCRLRRHRPRPKSAPDSNNVSFYTGRVCIIITIRATR